MVKVTTHIYRSPSSFAATQPIRVLGGWRVQPRPARCGTMANL